MQTGERVPAVTADTLLSNALVEITRKGLGMTAVVDHQRRVIGVYTDGDLRRTLDKALDIHATQIADVMTHDCKTAHPDQLAAELLYMMQNHKINSLPVIDAHGILIGALNMHDLLRAGVL